MTNIKAKITNLSSINAKVSPLSENRGIATDEELLAHTSRTDNPHSVTAGQVGADPAGSAGSVQSNLDTHIADNTNPHSVTAAQVGSYTTAQTDTLVQDAINALLDGAPDALNTLNELAAAINDDASFAASITSALSGKVDNSDFRDAVGIDASNWFNALESLIIQIKAADVDPAGTEIAQALGLRQLSSEKGQANGYAELDANGTVPVSQLPSLSLTDTIEVADQPTRLELTSAQAEGKIVVQIDTGVSYGLPTGNDPSVNGDWVELGDRDIQIADVSGLQTFIDSQHTPTEGQSGPLVTDGETITAPQPSVADVYDLLMREGEASGTNLPELLGLLLGGKFYSAVAPHFTNPGYIALKAAYDDDGGSSGVHDARWRIVQGSGDETTYKIELYDNVADEVLVAFNASGMTLPANPLGLNEGGTGGRTPQGARASLGVDTEEFVVGFPAKPEADETDSIPVSRNYTLKTTAGVELLSGVVTDAQTVYNILHNGSSVGTVTVNAASGTADTINIGSDVAIVAGDSIGIKAPASPDADHEDIQFSIPLEIA